MKAVNILWDTDGDTDTLDSLPTEIEIPDNISENEFCMVQYHFMWNNMLSYDCITCT